MLVSIAMILVLAAVRFLARGYFDTLLTVQQTGALFFVPAFGMIVRWRAQMLVEYRRLSSLMWRDGWPNAFLMGVPRSLRS